MNNTEFKSFNKMPRLSREMTITEKIDGTNAQIFIDGDDMLVGSRNRWITPEDDNHGFAAWVRDHKSELMNLGEGRHFGEWWGSGIQHGYAMKHKHFSLFNTRRWCYHNAIPVTYPTQDPRVMHTQQNAPACCSVVPILYEGPFDTVKINEVLENLRINGSVISTGVAAEGIVIYHHASGQYFKKTIEHDELPKSRV